MTAYAQHGPDGQRTVWSILSEDYIGVTIKGKAELITSGTRVTGDLETYFEGYPLPPVREQVSGTVAGDRMELNVVNPIEKTSAQVILFRAGDGWRGTWKANDTPAHGSIALMPRNDDPGDAVSNPLADNAALWWQADGLLKRGGNQLEANQTEAARDSFRQAAELFQRIGDLNKRSWALNGMGHAEQRLGLYEEARRHFSEVLDSGNIVDEGIRESARTGLMMVKMVLGLDPDQ